MVLLADFNHREQEKVQFVKNLNNGAHIFISALFLLLVYTVKEEKYILLLFIPLIIFSLFVWYIMNLFGVYLNATRILEIQNGINEILNKSEKEKTEFLNWERRYGGLFKDAKYNTAVFSRRLYPVFISTLAVLFLLSGAIGLFYLFKTPGNETLTYTMGIVYLILLWICYHLGRKFDDFREEETKEAGEDFKKK